MAIGEADDERIHTQVEYGADEPHASTHKLRVDFVKDAVIADELTAAALKGLGI